MKISHRYIYPIMTAIFGLSVSITSHAKKGGLDTGGGDAIVCPNTPYDQVYLADTFQFARAGGLDGLKQVRAGELMRIAIDLVELQYPQKIYDHPLIMGKKLSLAGLIEHTWANLYFDERYETLPELEDDFIERSSLPHNCYKQQLAIQDLPNRIVRVNKTLASQMSEAERGLFQFHETLIALRNSAGRNTTEIRDQVRALFDRPDKRFQRELRKIIRQKLSEKTLAERFAQSKYCIPTYVLTMGDLLVLAACNIANDWRNVSAPTSTPELPMRKLPQVLDCTIMSERRNDLNWHPGNFTLRSSENSSGDALSFQSADLAGAAKSLEGAGVKFEHYYERLEEFTGVISKNETVGGWPQIYSSFGISCSERSKL